MVKSSGIKKGTLVVLTGVALMVGVGFSASVNITNCSGTAVISCSSSRQGDIGHLNTTTAATGHLRTVATLRRNSDNAWLWDESQRSSQCYSYAGKHYSFHCWSHRARKA